MTRSDGIQFDVVDVNGVENDDVAVAAVQSDGETAGLVAVKAPFDASDRHLEMVRAIIEWYLRNCGHRVRAGISPSGTRASALLVHVAHFHLFYDFDELADVFGGEAWPPLEVASIDDFVPC